MPSALPVSSTRACQTRFLWDAAILRYFRAEALCDGSLGIGRAAENEVNENGCHASGGTYRIVGARRASGSRAVGVEECPEAAQRGTCDPREARRPRYLDDDRKPEGVRAKGT